jgi:hypothetical protein
MANKSPRATWRQGQAASHVAVAVKGWISRAAVPKASQGTIRSTRDHMHGAGVATRIYSRAYTLRPKPYGGLRCAPSPVHRGSWTGLRLRKP